jgi:hypothetical protein
MLKCPKCRLSDVMYAWNCPLLTILMSHTASLGHPVFVDLMPAKHKSPYVHFKDAAMNTR